MRRSTLLTTAAATAGVMIAFGVGLAANAIAGRSIASGPLPAASDLAPDAAPAVAAVAPATTAVAPPATTAASKVAEVTVTDAPKPTKETASSSGSSSGSGSSRSSGSSGGNCRAQVGVATLPSLRTTWRSVL